MLAAVALAMVSVGIYFFGRDIGQTPVRVDRVDTREGPRSHDEDHGSPATRGTDQVTVKPFRAKAEGDSVKRAASLSFSASPAFRAFVDKLKRDNRSLRRLVRKTSDVPEYEPAGTLSERSALMGPPWITLTALRSSDVPDAVEAYAQKLGHELFNKMEDKAAARSMIDIVLDQYRDALVMTNIVQKRLSYVAGHRPPGAEGQKELEKATIYSNRAQSTAKEMYDAIRRHFKLKTFD